MTIVDSTAAVFHVVFAGLWTGSILFFAWRIHPLIAAGDLGREPIDRIVSGLQWLTRAGVLVFLATGGHMAANRHSAESLVGTGRGHLVLTMLGLWLVLTAVVEVTGIRLLHVLEEHRPHVAGDRTRGLVRLAAILSVALLVVGGLLAV